MKKSLVVVLMAIGILSAQANHAWRKSSLIEIKTINGWCRHCPDWNQTLYSFKLEDGHIYTARTHATLNITVNGETKIRFGKDGSVGDSLFVIDDSGKEKKLRIVSKRIERQKNND